jgi:hypothetical protein
MQMARLNNADIDADRCDLITKAADVISGLGLETTFDRNVESMP